MMSLHLVLTREGYLKEVFHVLAYLKKHINSALVFDPTVPDIDMESFQKQDWKYYVYSTPGVELKEEVPPNITDPLGLPFVMRKFMDADHAGETMTKRSRSGYIIFLNSAPIYWHPRKQISCETRTFGSEFVALKKSTEYTCVICYYLPIFFIPVSEPSLVYDDKKSVLCNTTAPYSTLKKNQNVISLHFVREGCARDDWRSKCINKNCNVVDLMTNLLAREKCWEFAKMLQHYICTNSNYSDGS